jgi:hypothetical protein
MRRQRRGPRGFRKARAHPQRIHFTTGRVGKKNAAMGFVGARKTGMRRSRRAGRRW